MKIVLTGAGAVGARAVRQLAALPDVANIALLDGSFEKANTVAKSVGSLVNPIGLPTVWPEARRVRFAEASKDAAVVVLTGQRDQTEFAEIALRAGAHVVSVSDDLDDVLSLLALDALAQQMQKSVVVGAGFAPGLSCLLAKHAAKEFDEAQEIHVAKSGTGGPACARQHHKALRAEAVSYHEGEWDYHLGGTGRELCWFPDPIGGLDCYYAQLADPKLLQVSFPEVAHISARVSATRRDQATKWLPMMRRPHPEGLIGAIRVEVRGVKAGLPKSVVLGVLDRPAVAAGTMAAALSRLAVQGELAHHGAGGVASMVKETVPMLEILKERGVKAAIFEGRETGA